MKKIIAILLILSILILSGCRNAGPAGEFSSEETSTPTTHQTDSENQNSGPFFTDPENISIPTESVSQTEPGAEKKPDPTTSTRDNKPESGENPNESGKHSDNSQTEPVKIHRPTGHQAA